MSDLIAAKKLLEEQVVRNREARKKQQNIFIGLAVILCLSLSFTYSRLSQLTPGLFMDAGIVQIQSNVGLLNDYLQDSAPLAASFAADKLLDAPVAARKHIEKGLTPKVDDIARVMRKNLLRHMNIAAKAHKRLPEAPNAAEIDAQMNAAIDRILADGRASMLHVVDNFYYQNSNTMRELNNHLRHLAHSRKLSEQERLERNVLGSWLSVLDQQGTSWAISW